MLFLQIVHGRRVRLFEKDGCSCQLADLKVFRIDMLSQGDILFLKCVEIFVRLHVLGQTPLNSEDDMSWQPRVPMWVRFTTAPRGRSDSTVLDLLLEGKQLILSTFILHGKLRVELVCLRRDSLLKLSSDEEVHLRSTRPIVVKVVQQAVGVAISSDAGIALTSRRAI